MTLDLTTKTPRECVCCELTLGPEARMGVCVNCVRDIRGNYLYCFIHGRRIARVPELR